MRRGLLDIDTEQEEHLEEQDASVAICGFFILFVIAVLDHVYHESPAFKRISMLLPLPSANLALGIFAGAFLSLSTFLDTVFRFDPEFFFVYLLPPCIFAAGLAIQKDAFFFNFGSIMVLAFAGTILSSFFIGGMVHLFGNWGAIHSLDFTDSMILGSLISAVDPIATIVVLEKLEVEPDLYILIFGEAVLNDAAAITINRVFVKIKDTHEGAEAIGGGMALILWTGFASIMIGIVLGLGTAFAFKHTNLKKHPHLELSIYFVLAFLPYVICELLGLSGIMAILFMGIFMDYYTRHHLSEKTAETVTLTNKSIATMVESWIFVYLGMAIFTEKGQNYDSSFIFFVLFLCLLGRAVSVVPLCYILNRFRPHDKLNWKYQAVMWFSGLRGPVAFALAHGAPNDTGIILTTSLMIIFITTFVIGGVTLPVCSWLDLAVGPKRFNRKANWFHVLDGRFLRPYFGVPRRVGWKHDTYSIPSTRDTDDEEHPASIPSPNAEVELAYDMGAIEMIEKKDSLMNLPDVPEDNKRSPDRKKRRSTSPAKSSTPEEDHLMNSENEDIDVIR